MYEITRDVAEQLIEFGEVTRPWISISGVDVNPKLVAYYNLQISKGVMITRRRSR